MFGDSENCCPKSIEKLFPFKDTNIIIAYFQWETVVVERNVKKKKLPNSKKSDENRQCGRGDYSKITRKVVAMSLLKVWIKELSQMGQQKADKICY